SYSPTASTARTTRRASGPSRRSAARSSRADKTRRGAPPPFRTSPQKQVAPAKPALEVGGGLDGPLPAPLPETGCAGKAGASNGDHIARAFLYGWSVEARPREAPISGRPSEAGSPGVGAAGRPSPRGSR